VSKKTHTQRVAESIWLSVLHDHDHYFKKPWETFFLKKLKQARFTKRGEMRMNSVGSMAALEFPTIYAVWKERMDAKNND